MRESPDDYYDRIRQEELDAELFGPAAAKLMHATNRAFDLIFAEPDPNDGARIADESFCSVCGKRGVIGLCRECSE